MQEGVIKQEVATMNLAGEVDPDPHRHRPDSTLSGGLLPPPSSPLLAPESKRESKGESKPRPDDGHVFAKEESPFGSPGQDRLDDGLLNALPLEPEQPGPRNEETQQQRRDDIAGEQEESVHLGALGSEICSDDEEEDEAQDGGSLQLGAEHEVMVSQPLHHPPIHPSLQWYRPKEEEDHQQRPPFKVVKASRGKERLLEEDDFPLLDRSEPSGQKDSLSNSEPYAFPCDMHIPTLVDMSLPTANEFEYSPTLRGLRNECAFRQIQQPGIDHIGCFSDLMPTADVVAAEQQTPASGMCRAVHAECHNLRTEEQIVKAEDRRASAPLDESGDGTWRTDSFIAQQLGVQGLGAAHSSIPYAPVITLPKSLEELQSFEGGAVVPPFRFFNTSPGAVQPSNPFRLLGSSPDAGHAAACASFETFDEPQISNEAVHPHAHAQRTVLPTPSLSGLHVHLPEGASVGAPTDRHFIVRGDTCISPGDARGVCFKTDGAESPPPAAQGFRPSHDRVSFPEGPYAYKSQPSTDHHPNVNMGSPHMHYEVLHGSETGSGSGSGPKFLETPAVTEAKMKTEILRHPMFAEMLAAHVACLRVTVPESHMLGLPEQLTRSQDLLQAYSSVVPQTLDHLGEEIDLQHSNDMNKFMKGHIDALWNLQARLEHCVPQIVREAMLFISNVENETKALFAFANQDSDVGELFESNMNEVGDDETAMQGFSRNEEFGPLVPTASERSTMERIREQLKSELTEEGYRKKIMEVRDEILRKRRAGKLPTGTTSILKDWWSAHVSWPYPTEDEKERLMDETGLELKQINNWFINQRKRNWNNGASSSKANDRKNKRG